MYRLVFNLYMYIRNKQTGFMSVVCCVGKVEIQIEI